MIYDPEKFQTLVNEKGWEPGLRSTLRVQEISNNS